MRDVPKEVVEAERKLNTAVRRLCRTAHEVKG